MARIWMATWGFGLEDRGSPLGDYSNRLDRAWQLDRVFEMARARHIAIILTLADHTAFSTNRGASGNWAGSAYNVANGDLRPWLATMATVMADNDPYHHLLTTSFADGRKTSVWDAPSLAFTQQHVYDAGDPVALLPEVVATLDAAAPGKPALLAEFVQRLLPITRRPAIRRVSRCTPGCGPRRSPGSPAPPCNGIGIASSMRAM